MTILSAQTIHARALRKTHSPAKPIYDLRIIPFERESKTAYGMSYGLSSCGYDIRVGVIDRHSYLDSMRTGKPLEECHAQEWVLRPGDFLLCSSLEYMELPNDLCGKVHDKSTLARQGLALQNTILEPGWRGYITLELSNHSSRPIPIRVGQPIAQVLFELLDQPTTRPYRGKYQDQAARPVHSILVPDPD